jgi:hypothetical protein
MGETLLGKVKNSDTELVKWSGAPAGLSEVRWTRTTVGGPNDLGGSVTASSDSPPLPLETLVGAGAAIFEGLRTVSRTLAILLPFLGVVAEAVSILDSPGAAGELCSFNCCLVLELSAIIFSSWMVGTLAAGEGIFIICSKNPKTTLDWISFDLKQGKRKKYYLRSCEDIFGRFNNLCL